MLKDMRCNKKMRKNNKLPIERAGHFGIRSVAIFPEILAAILNDIMVTLNKIYFPTL